MKIDSPTKILGNGAMAIEYGRPERGVFLLKRQLIIDPSNVKARILLLEALLKLERYNAAKQHVQESLAQPTGIQFELQLANVVARLEAEKAEAALQRDIADEPTTDEQSIDTTRVPDRKSYEIVDIGLLPDEIEPRSSETAALQDPFEDVEAGAIGFPAPLVAKKLIALSETKPIKPAPTQDPRPTPIKQPTPKYGAPKLVSRYRATVSGALSHSPRVNLLTPRTIEVDNCRTTPSAARSPIHTLRTSRVNTPGYRVKSVMREKTVRTIAYLWLFKWTQMSLTTAT